jgi:hypothetical protein
MALRRSWLPCSNQRNRLRLMKKVESATHAQCATSVAGWRVSEPGFGLVLLVMSPRASARGERTRKSENVRDGRVDFG